MAFTISVHGKDGRLSKRMFGFVQVWPPSPEGRVFLLSWTFQAELQSHGSSRTVQLAV